MIVIVALLIGIALGALARIWMRLIAPDPEFTVAGTLGIVVGFGLLFTGAAFGSSGWMVGAGPYLASEALASPVR